MARILRIVFKFVELLLAVVIGIFILLPKELEVEKDAVETTVETDLENPKIKPHHLLCKSQVVTAAKNETEIISNALKWKENSTKSLKKNQLYYSVSCWESTNKTDDEKDDKCFCVLKSLWMMGAALILAVVCVIAILAELAVISQSDDTGQGYMGAGVCSIVVLVSWGVVAGMILYFVILKWTFQYKDRTADRNYYKIPIDYYIVMGLCWGYVLVSLCEMICYMVISARKQKDQKIRTSRGSSVITTGGNNDLLIVEIRDKSDKSKSDRSGQELKYASRPKVTYSGRSNLNQPAAKVSNKSCSISGSNSSLKYMELKDGSQTSSPVKKTSTEQPITLHPTEGGSSSKHSHRRHHHQKLAQPKSSIIKINNDPESKRKH